MCQHMPLHFNYFLFCTKFLPAEEVVLLHKNIPWKQVYHHLIFLLNCEALLLCKINNLSFGFWSSVSFENKITINSQKNFLSKLSEQGRFTYDFVKIGLRPVIKNKSIIWMRHTNKSQTTPPLLRLCLIYMVDLFFIMGLSFFEIS